MVEVRYDVNNVVFMKRNNIIQQKMIIACILNK